MRFFLLQYGDRRYTLTPGSWSVGRRSSCHVSLNSSRVSRHHATLHVSHDSVEIEDEGSRNGVFLDGQRVRGRTRVEHGGRITIGGRDLFIYERTRLRREQMETLDGIPPVQSAVPQPEARSDNEEGETDGTGLHDVLMAQVGTLLEQNATERASELVRELYTALHTGLATPGVVDEPAIWTATRYALSLAERTKAAEWIERIFELHSVEPRTIPQDTVDRINRLLPRMEEVRREPVNRYIQAMRSQQEPLHPKTDALLQQLESLAEALRD